MFKPNGKNRSLFAVRLFALSVLLLASRGYCYSVLWDLSHGVAGDGLYQPSDGYTGLALGLQANGFSVDTTSAGFLADGLSEYNVAVVCLGSSYDSAYSTAEIELLTSFVNSGGGLIIMSGHLFTPNENISALAEEFGISIGLGSNTISNTYTSNLAEHEVFDGFGPSDSIYLLGGGGLAVSGGALGVAWENGQIVVAVSEYGAGRVVAIGDFNMWSDVAGTYDMAKNAEFALNAFNYVAVPEPATILILGFGGLVLLRRS